ncbi:MAG: bifunctional (p)ppGpp synthetase/guanosine-3',5'-bis(diphosphate) 3'-pyrophosphohydrolase [Chloroflexota bacterium]
MSSEQLLKILPERYTPADREIIERAFRLAKAAHGDQKRESGEPYTSHCLEVGKILAEMRVPPPVIVAGLLHDIVEDTDVTLEDVRRDFGEEVATLVDGVTKLIQLPRVSRVGQEESILEEEVEETPGISPIDWEEITSLKRQRHYDLSAETWRKTFLAMGEDIRVVLIKFADRLHNMRTLRHLPGSRRQRIAQETLDLYAPLANRLGIWQMKWEFEDLAFRYLDPAKYREIANQLAETRAAREKELNEIIGHLETILKKEGIQAVVDGRPKHIYSIFRKMQRKGLPFEMISDVRGVRVYVPTVSDCYATLGVIHTHWRPRPNEFDDYIAAPKDNFYQSLHTSVSYDDGKTLEVQIRTQEMHQNAEYGIAAHWRYKEGIPQDEDYERRIRYLRQLMEWRLDVEDAEEFVDGMKSDVFKDRVYVFTPRGDIIDLPAGATPIDFAFHIHTDIGYRCRGAKVNGKLTALGTELKTGNQVEILTAKRGGPSRDWLNPHLGLVKTQRARSKIKRWFKRQDREKNIQHGKTLLEKELHRLGVGDINIDELAQQFEYKSSEDLFEALGCGDIQLGKVVNQFSLVEEEKEEVVPLEAEALSEGDVQVLGLKGLLTRLARCCNPAPGDEIIGYITRGRGATIHKRDCPNILNIRDKERLAKVSWGEPESTYAVSVRVTAYDRDGLMRDVSTVIAEEAINMPRVMVEVQGNLAIFDLTLNVRNVAQLSKVLTRIESLTNVMEAHRVRPG